MNARERAILFGKNVKPATIDESALAYAVAHGGGSEPTYETVAEIHVGAPVEDVDGVPEGCVAYVVADTASTKAIIASAGDSLYFNNAETPLTRLTNEMAVFGYNVEMGEVSVVTGQPAYLVAAVDEDGTDAIVELMSTEDLSNTTVRILKQVEQGGATAGKLVVHLTETEEGGVTIYTADKSVTEIIAADAAGQVVECVCDGQHCALLTTENSSSAACVFSTVTIEDGNFTGLFIVGSNDKQDGSVDKWDVSESEVEIPSNLKPTYVVHLKIGENDTATVDEDIDDILAAIANGQNVKAVYSTGGTYYELQLNLASRDAGSSDASITFYMMMRNSTTTLSIMELIVERINGVKKATVKTMTVAITLDA